MKSLYVVALGLAAAAICHGTSFAEAAQPRASLTNAAASLDLAAAKRKKVRRSRSAYQPQIACTVFGCQPVPRGCRPEPGRYWSGMTTGFDVVVCP